LRHHGFDVFIPYDQGGSGIEALAHGDAETAREIAQKAIQDAELKVKILGLVLPVIATIASLVLSSMLGLFQPSWKDPLQKVQQDVAVLQSEKDVGQINKQIHDLEDQIRTLEQKMPVNPPASKH